MNNIPVFVGLDYHACAIQVCVMDDKGDVLWNRSCANSWRAIVENVERQGQVVRAAIESCSGAADIAEELVSKAGWPVDLAHPGYVRRMKQNPDKTDYSDARMLADLERVGYLPRVWLAPQAVRELRLLVRYRQQLVNRRRATKLRIGAVLREQRVSNNSISRWCKAWVEWLRGHAPLSTQGRWVVEQHFAELDFIRSRITAVEDRLTLATANDVLVERLQQYAGIGKVTAWMLRAEVGRFDRFNSGKQLARFCGLTPRNASSGMRQADAGLIRAASPLLRSTLIEAGHRLIRWDARWREMAARLIAKGKPINVAVAAVANRWIRWLYHQVPKECYA